MIRALVALTSADPVPSVSRLGAWTALTDRELEGLTVPAAGEYNVGNAGRLDPEGSKGAERWTSPCEGFGEDGTGVILSRSPEALLLERPHLWEAVERYRLGHADLRPEDADHLDALTWSALAVAVQCHHRVVASALEAHARPRQPDQPAQPGTFGGRPL